MSQNYKVAVVGASGLVGRTALQVLEEKRLPISDYVFLTSCNSAGKSVSFMGKDYVFSELNEHSFDEGFDFAIFAAGGDTAKKYAPIAASKGCIVIDNSSAFRMDPSVPLVVPEVNAKEALNHKGIIANPNCSTIQAVVPLKVLDDHYDIKRIVYSTYQAVSGAGVKGLSDLEHGQDDSYTLKKFPHPIYNNCLPHIDVFLDNGSTKEEEKMVLETRKILQKPDLRISATAVRVPVTNCHSESINIEFAKDFDLEEVKSLLSNAPGIVVQDDTTNNIYPLASTADGHDEVFVGRIRRDESVPYGLNLWVVADNIRKGAASNAVQILEYLISKKK